VGGTCNTHGKIVNTYKLLFCIPKRRDLVVGERTMSKINLKKEIIRVWS